MLENQLDVLLMTWSPQPSEPETMPLKTFVRFSAGSCRRQALYPHSLRSKGSRRYLETMTPKPWKGLAEFSDRLAGHEDDQRPIQRSTRLTVFHYISEHSSPGARSL